MKSENFWCKIIPHEKSDFEVIATKFPKQKFIENFVILYFKMSDFHFSFKITNRILLLKKKGE